jgi:tryptophan synthase alpha chain
MNRISQTFQRYNSDKRAVIVPYITPEYPIQGVTIPLILALEASGAAMIEVGIPFSDPLADGPTIQHSSEIAIKNGVNVTKVLEMVRDTRTKTAIPLLLMGYINPILKYGIEKFLIDAKRSGVDGLIIPDLPPEESAEFCALSKREGIGNVFLIAPTSSDERIRFLDELSTDFTYCVSITGVTGSSNVFGASFDEFLTRVKTNTKKPFVVGFGITNKEQVSHISQKANGVVVGSALLKAIAGKKSVDDVTSAAKHFISSLM